MAYSRHCSATGQVAQIGLGLAGERVGDREEHGRVGILAGGVGEEVGIGGGGSSAHGFA